MTEKRLYRLTPLVLLFAPISSLASPTHFSRVVNYTGHCQTSTDRPSPCDAMTLVYDLDHDRRVTVVFAEGPGIAARFPGRACTFHRVAERVVGVDCGYWKFRVGGK